MDSVTSQDWLLFRLMIILVPVYVVVTAVVVMLNEILIKKLISRVICQLRGEVYDGIIHHETERFRSVNTAEYISALTNDIKIVEDHALIPFLKSLKTCLLLILRTARCWNRLICDLRKIKNML